MTSSRGTVLITGASTGIGEATARHLDSLGFHVLAGVRRPEDGDRLREGSTERLRTLELDVTDEASVDSAAAAVAAAVGRRGLAGLFNNAGIAIGGPVEVVPLEEWRRQFEVNVVGQVAMTQALLPALRDARGRIVFTGSMGGRLAAPYLGPYNASKHALEGLADSLRREVRGFGIRVSILEPGAVGTDIWEKGRQDEARMREQLAAGELRHYDHVPDLMRRQIQVQVDNAVPTSVVAAAVEHALTARRPRTRYLIGRDARIGVRLSDALPTPLMDRVVARLMR